LLMNLEQDRNRDTEVPLRVSRDEPILEVPVELIRPVQEGGVDLLPIDVMPPPEKVVPGHVDGEGVDKGDHLLAQLAEVGVGESDFGTTIMSVLRTP